MATITEDYVSFETAKLLKGKGFEGDTNAYYHIWDNGKKVCSVREFKHSEAPHLYIPALSIYTAMKWLREVHNIMVSPYALSLGYYFEIFDLTNRDVTGCKPLYKVGIPNKEDVLSTYGEAAEAAIKYCLENLI